jgi:SAM-dependent methyltransferase
VSYQPGGDLCLGFFAKVWNPDLLPLPEHATVLEIGCAEADWQTPMLQLRPDLQITGIDVRSCDRPGTVIVGDVLTHDFAPASFDAIVSVSAIEHIGLGAYGDPTDPDGDVKAMQRAAAWLKPGGWLYLDVPYRPNGPYIVTEKFRAYDRAQLDARLIEPSGLWVPYRQTFTPEHPDGPYIALVLTKDA